MMEESQEEINTAHSQYGRVHTDTNAIDFYPQADTQVNESSFEDSTAMVQIGNDLDEPILFSHEAQEEEGDEQLFEKRPPQKHHFTLTTSPGKLEDFVQAELITPSCLSCSKASPIITYRGIDCCKACGAVILPNTGSFNSSDDDAMIDVVEPKRFQLIKAKEDQAEAEIHPVETWDAIKSEVKINCGQSLSVQNLQLRARVFELICSLAEKTGQRELTKHYALQYLDQLLERSDPLPPVLLNQTNPKNEAIIAPTCLLLGSKFDEIDENIPQIQSLLRTYNRCLRFARPSSSQRASTASNWNATAMTITYEDMIRAEKEALQIVQWELLQPMPRAFVQCLLYMGVVVGEEKTIDGCKIDEARLDKVRANAYDFCLEAIQDYDLKSTYSPQVIGLSCVQASRRLNLLPPLPASFFTLLSLREDFDAVQGCAQLLLQPHLKPLALPKPKSSLQLLAPPQLKPSSSNKENVSVMAPMHTPAPQIDKLSTNHSRSRQTSQSSRQYTLNTQPSLKSSATMREASRIGVTKQNTGRASRQAEATQKGMDRPQTAMGQQRSAIPKNAPSSKLATLEVKKFVVNLPEEGTADEASKSRRQSRSRSKTRSPAILRYQSNAPQKELVVQHQPAYIRLSTIQNEKSQKRQSTADAQPKMTKAHGTKTSGNKDTLLQTKDQRHLHCVTDPSITPDHLTLQAQSQALQPTNTLISSVFSKKSTGAACPASGASTSRGHKGAPYVDDFPQKNQGSMSTLLNLDLEEIREPEDMAVGGDQASQFAQAGPKKVSAAQSNRSLFNYEMKAQRSGRTSTQRTANSSLLKSTTQAEVTVAQVSTSRLHRKENVKPPVESQKPQISQKPIQEVVVAVHQSQKDNKQEPTSLLQSQYTTNTVAQHVSDFTLVDLPQATISLDQLMHPSIMQSDPISHQELLPPPDELLASHRDPTGSRPQTVIKNQEGNQQCSLPSQPSNSHTPNSRSKSNQKRRQTMGSANNFIKKNISYISSLNNQLKDKRSERAEAPTKRGKDKHSVNEPLILRPSSSAQQESPSFLPMPESGLEEKKQEILFEYLKPTASSLQRIRSAISQNTRKSRKDQHPSMLTANQAFASQLQMFASAHVERVMNEDIKNELDIQGGPEEQLETQKVITSINEAEISLQVKQNVPQRSQRNHPMFSKPQMLTSTGMSSKTINDANQLGQKIEERKGGRRFGSNTRSSNDLHGNNPRHVIDASKKHSVERAITSNTTTFGHKQASTTKHASRKSITRSFNTAASGLETQPAYSHRPSSSISSASQLAQLATVTSISNLKTTRDGQSNLAASKRPQTSLNHQQIQTGKHTPNASAAKPPTSSSSKANGGALYSARGAAVQPQRLYDKTRTTTNHIHKVSAMIIEELAEEDHKTNHVQPPKEGIPPQA